MKFAVNRWWCLAIVGFLMAVSVGCRQAPSEVGHYKTPVFPGAQLSKQHTADSASGWATTTVWTFKVSEPLKAVIQFYQQQLGDAEQVDQTGPEFGEGRSYKFVVRHGGGSDQVSVEIMDYQLTISESRK